MLLITGATGMTGHFVVQELQRRNLPIRVLVRAKSLDKAPPNTEIALGDLADSASLRRATQGVSGIIHTACTFSNSAVDIAAMQALLDGWQEGPFVFVSSLDVYGYAQFSPISEEHPLDHSYSDYAHGKIVCEQMLAEKAAAAGRNDYASLRASYIWGPHPKAQRMLKLAHVLASEPIILPGVDEAEWSEYGDVWIDVRDLAWITAECLQRPPAVAINTLSGHFSWHELYATLIDLTGSSSQIVHKALEEITESELPNKEGRAQRWRFSDERLRRTLGFTPRFTLRQMLQAVVEQK